MRKRQKYTAFPNKEFAQTNQKKGVQFSDMRTLAEYAEKSFQVYVILDNGLQKWKGESTDPYGSKSAYPHIFYFNYIHFMKSTVQTSIPFLNQALI